MVTLLVTCVSLVVASGVTGLECWNCGDMDTPQDCAKRGRLETCAGQNDVCQTIVRVTGDARFVVKGCKEDIQCKKNEMRDHAASRMTCCCHGDACNAATSTCIESKGCPPLPTTQRTSFSCSDGREVGSECEITCKGEGFRVYPSDDAAVVSCLGNGSWSKPTPCCARPCPPYFVYDSVLLYHTSHPSSFRAVMTLIEQSARRLAIGEDSVLFAGFYYSGTPLLSSKHFLNEYQGDVAILTDILSKRLRPTNTDDGLVNTGKAMEYALDHFYSSEAGARGAGVPKVLTVITDSNSDDDVSGPTDRARKLGISTNVILLKSHEREVNMEEFRGIAGSDDHVFVIDVDKPDVDAYFAQAERQFCKAPC